MMAKNGDPLALTIINRNEVMLFLIMTCSWLLTWKNFSFLTGPASTSCFECNAFLIATNYPFHHGSFGISLVANRSFPCSPTIIFRQWRCSPQEPRQRMECRYTKKYRGRNWKRFYGCIPHPKATTGLPGDSTLIKTPLKPLYGCFQK